MYLFNYLLNLKTEEKQPSSVYFDKNDIKTIKYEVKPLAEQKANESRHLWKDVTYFLTKNNVEKATDAKCQIEADQRFQNDVRKQKGLGLPNVHFKQTGELLWDFVEF